MIKISQLPDAKVPVGGEIFPIVQEHETRKAKAIYIGPDNKIVIPDEVEIVSHSGGKEIKLLSAKVVDGVTSVYVGDTDINLYKGDVPVVTEATVSDGNAYVRINNKWAIRNPITSINTKRPLTGGGDISISSSDVKAHISNDNRNGRPFVSQDGVWISLSSVVDPLLADKADKIHVHQISDVETLQNSLDRIESKADNYAHDPAYGSAAATNFTSTAAAGHVTLDKQSIVSIDHTEQVLTVTKPGYYMITLSGNGTGEGKYAVQIDDIPVDSLTVESPGRFSCQDIIDIKNNSTIKVGYETSDLLSAKLVMTIHRM